MFNKKPNSNSVDSVVAIDRYINAGLFFGLLLAACITIYSSLNLMNITGPTAVAVDSNGVVVALFDRLIRMSKDGLIIHDKKKESLGIHGLVNDIQPLANGDLIIGDGGSRSLYKCDSEMVSCKPLNSSYDAGKYHKFYVDENNQHIVLSNTERNELVLLNMDGSLKKVLISKTGMLMFPDGVAVIDDDQIFLANAIKKQLLKISISSSEAIIIDTYDVNSRYVVDGQSLPMSLSRVSGNDWWVAAQANAVSHGASVLRFNESMMATGRLLFDGLIHPVDIQDIGSLVLVADMHAHRVFAFDHEGNDGQIFGDSVFNSILDEQKTTKEFSGYVRWVSMALVIMLLALAIIIEGVRKKEKQKNEELKRMNKPDDGIKITVPESFAKMYRTLPVITVVMAGAAGFLLYGSMPESVIVIGSIEALMCFSIFIIMMMIVKHMPKSIEVESGLISFVTQKDEVITDHIANVSYTNNFIIIKHDYFMLGAKGVLLNDKDGYKKLMGFLEGAKKLGAWKVQKLLIKKEKNSYFMLSVILLLIFLLMPSVVTNDEVKKEGEIFLEVVSP